MEREKVRRIIYEELPEIMRQDKEVQQFILHLSRQQFADKVETESRFDRVLARLERESEEDRRRWAEQSKLWRENQARWEEQTKLWRENQARLEKKAQEDKARWAEQTELWRENQERWEKNDARLDGMLTEIQKLNQKHDSTIGALGARWGLHSEASFRNGLRGILEDSFGVDVEVLNVNEYDHDGEVFGRPDQIELDLIIHNGTLIIAEIKSSISKSDMHTFYTKASFYQRHHQQQADRLIVISPMVDERALRVAERLGIEVFSYAWDVKPT